MEDLYDLQRNIERQIDIVKENTDDEIRELDYRIHEVENKIDQLEKNFTEKLLRITFLIQKTISS